MRENKRKTLRGLLIFLGRLMDDPSSLSPGRKNAAIAAAARTEAAGWKYLAGEGGNIDELLSQVGEAPTELLRHRRDPAPGRREGSVAKHTAAKDQLVLADIDNGIKIGKAIRAHYSAGFEAHKRRINRRRAERRGEIKRIIALQTTGLRVIK